MAGEALRVVMVHNYYQQRGGEDESFELEAAMLEARGHEVRRFTRHNDELAQQGRVAAAFSAVWNRESYRELRALIRADKPDVVHFQNTFPLVSPGAYYAATREDVPVVQSLRNYRIVCSNALLFRDGTPCELCLTKPFQIHGVRYACYRDSRPASAAVATAMAFHRAVGTWRKKVDLYIALSEFTRTKFIEAGFDPARIAVKPNLARDYGIGDGAGGYGLFVGRLSKEKGIRTLIKAWQRAETSMELIIVGEGPDRELLEKLAPSNVRFAGHQPSAAVADAMKRARFLVFPSEWYETFGRVAIEAYSTGTPVLASDIGAISELVEEGANGYLFTAGDVESLAALVRRMEDQGSARAAAMRSAARRTYEQKYSANRNHALLTGLYERAIAARANHT